MTLQLMVFKTPKYFIINKQTLITNPYLGFIDMESIRNFLRFKIRETSRNVGKNYIELESEEINDLQFNYYNYHLSKLVDYLNEHHIVEIDIFSIKEWKKFGEFIGIHKFSDNEIIKSKSLWFEAVKIGAVKKLVNDFKKLSSSEIILKLHSKNPITKSYARFYLNRKDK